MSSRRVLKADVLIAGTGPVGATYARKILDAKPTATVIMVDIGSQDSPVIGTHHKNSIKYQRDIDQFVYVIKGALQPISVSPADAFIPSLGGEGWRPKVKANGELESLTFRGNNPDQKPAVNLKASAVTRTVGGMGTHWTCACPEPHEKERVELEKLIPWGNSNNDNLLGDLLRQAGDLLKVSRDQFNESVRQIVVRKALVGNDDVKPRVQNLPLAVERRKDNPIYVTWSGSDTILGELAHKKIENFTLLPEHRVTKVLRLDTSPDRVPGVLLKDLTTEKTKLVLAKAVVLCCGAVPTPQILFNSGMHPELPALGRYLCEQSLSFCQIVLREEYIDKIPRSEQDNWDGYDDNTKAAILKHRKNYPDDPLPIPFTDPDPQINLPYSDKTPWHVQIHRDAFSYGDVGPRADSRVVVDLRFFGAQEAKKDNRVSFDDSGNNTDIYGMPQATFHVERSKNDLANDHKMMADMTKVANILGSYLPGSYPQFMDPGLALHITGTIRLGTNKDHSVADKDSKVHGIKNLWVGGNGCLPDSTACNPTRTSVAIAIKGSHAVVKYVWP